MVDVKNFMNGMNEVKMNEVIVNGVRFELNDEQTTVVLAKISQLLNGVVPSQTVEQSTKTVSKATEPKSYEPKEDITVRYFTDKTDDGKYFINFKATTVKKDGTITDRFKTPRDIKALVKAQLKAIKGIKELDNHFTDKNGKNVTYKVYGFSTKKACEDKLASLKTIFTVSERKEVQ